MVKRLINFPWNNKDNKDEARVCLVCGKVLGEDDLVIELWKLDSCSGVYCSWECRLGEKNG